MKRVLLIKLNSCRMEHNLNYGFTGATSQAYPDSQEWEFPLSASLAEIEQATTHQLQEAMRHQMSFEPPRPEAVAVPVDASNENAEVIVQAVAVNIPGQSKRGGKGNKTARGNDKRVSQRGKSFSKEEDRIICSAFLNVSKDPITGVSPSLDKF
ncbi:uncharacterized protein LOC120671179 [Panicum virgatum]|uniref:uncharacterized protein LOC120671179 n=1 Tax=Panicum virgatum TaxID=38727 RepID=UPI0019D5E8E3|nr:uncharacterized protein LOC120671179 [Panicum virgatum]